MQRRTQRRTKLRQKANTSPRVVQQHLTTNSLEPETKSHQKSEKEEKQKEKKKKKVS